jgi:ubiquinone/menaquinone biosynthesis C-methylase UbiE
VLHRGLGHHDQFARIAPYYDLLMASVPYARWADYVSDLALLVGHPIVPGSRLLDLATGTGSVALEFANRGCEVTGLDLSEPMLEVGRAKAQRAGRNVEFLRRDLVRFDLPPEFDHAVCLYDSLNYVLEPSDLKRAFANVNTIHALEAEMFTQASGPNALVRYRWQSKYQPKTRLTEVKMDFEIAATGEKIHVVHRQRGYTDEEIRRRLSEAGFGEIRGYDSYRFQPPTDSSDRVFYVALPR